MSVSVSVNLRRLGMILCDGDGDDELICKSYIQYVRHIGSGWVRSEESWR